MAKALTLFLLLTYFWGCNAQFTMSQPPSVSAALGETVQISCKRRGGRISDHFNSWYQQMPGSRPKLLIYRDDDRASGISDRFSGSLDGSANAAVLTISNVQAEDEANYYCSSYDSIYKLFGGGTQLSVLGQPASRPTVNVFSPSPEELRTTDKATLPCLVSDFMPPAIQVDWLADGSPISSGVETTKPTKHNDKYMLSSYLTMPSSEWEKHNEYTCKVTHEGSEYRKTVNRSQ